MPQEKTWEMIVAPKKPIPLDSLEVIVAEGEPLNIGYKRPDLYREALDFWNKTLVENTLSRSSELSDALNKRDSERLARLTKQIAGNNPKFRMTRATLNGNKLYLALNSTSYEDFVGTNVQAITNQDFRTRMMQAGLGDYGDVNHYFANPIAACAIIYGQDKSNRESEICVPISMRSNKVVIYPNVPHVFGGLVDLDEKTNKINLGHHIRTELREEIGIEDERIGGALFYGIVRQKPSRHTEVILGIPVFASSEEIKECWKNNASGKYESRNLTFYTISELPGFLEQNMSTMAPPGAAAISLFLENIGGKR